jgi:hypothetical protein
VTLGEPDATVAVLAVVADTVASGGVAVATERAPTRGVRGIIGKP